MNCVMYTWNIVILYVYIVHMYIFIYVLTYIYTQLHIYIFIYIVSSLQFELYNIDIGARVIKLTLWSRHYWRTQQVMDNFQAIWALWITCTDHLIHNVTALREPALTLSSLIVESATVLVVTSTPLPNGPISWLERQKLFNTHEIISVGMPSLVLPWSVELSTECCPPPNSVWPWWFWADLIRSDIQTCLCLAMSSESSLVVGTYSCGLV